MNERPPLWSFIDGVAAFSFSMLICLVIRSNEVFAEVWGISFIYDLTHENDGLVAAMTLLLLPSAAILYGGAKMIFAAKEAVEKKAREKGRSEGIAKGRAEERRRIQKLLERQGIELSLDDVQDRNGTDASRS